MFSMAEIDELHVQLGRADTLRDYLQGLYAIGVVRFDSFVSDGHSEFVGKDGHRVVSPPHHAVLEVAGAGDRSAVVEHLRRHGDGETSYLQMSTDLAASGIAKWVADTGNLTMAYCDLNGAAVLIEQIE